MRSLSQNFVDILKSGFLKPLLDLIIIDSTLCLEIRENYINIYYRGGNIIKIEEKQEAFKASFDRKYLNKDLTKVPELSGVLNDIVDVEVWIDAIPSLKHEMDLWFGKHPKNERECQQLMLRENNFGTSAKSTDYFICDIEYANPNGRFDIVAVHWPSSSAERKNNSQLDLAFIEMKFLDNALAGNAGLKRHVEDIEKFLGKCENLSNIKNEMKAVFNQKIELGLIDNQNPIESFSDNKPEYILALINHDPASSVLKRELQDLPPLTQAELKFAVSNFLGYGLYDQCIYDLDDFLKQFKDRV